MIIGILGKKQSGKDTVGSIIQYLSTNPSGKMHSKTINFEAFCKYANSTQRKNCNWEIKKFADNVVKSYKLIKGVDFHKLSKEDKEKERYLFIEYAQACKKIFGEDVWVNSLMKDYLSTFNSWNSKNYKGSYVDSSGETYPNWIITDVRFSNEIKVIDNKGFTIRVVKDIEVQGFEHISETSLDEFIPNYTIDNNGTIKELIVKVREILIKEKLI